MRRSLRLTYTFVLCASMMLTGWAAVAQRHEVLTPPQLERDYRRGHLPPGSFIRRPVISVTELGRQVQDRVPAPVPSGIDLAVLRLSREYISNNCFAPPAAIWKLKPFRRPGSTLLNATQSCALCSLGTRTMNLSN